MRRDAIMCFFEQIRAFAKHQGVGGAGCNASRFKSNIDALRTHRAFVNERALDEVLIVIKVRHTKRTGVHAITTTDAFVVVINHRAIFAFAVCTNRTS